MQILRPLLAAVAALSLGGCSVLAPVDSRLTPVSFESLPGCSPDEVAELPAGAGVVIVEHSPENSSRVNRGTVLKATRDGVALINWRIENRVVSGTPLLSEIPVIDRYFKNTGVSTNRVPVQWVYRRRMNSVRVIQLPPPGYVAPEISLDTVGLDPERIGVEFDFNIEDTPPGTIIPIETLHSQ